MLLSDAIDGYLLFKSSAASGATIEVDTVLLKQFLGWLGDCSVGEVESRQIGDYLAFQRERGLSSHTLRRHHAVLSALFAWLSGPDIALVSHDPTHSIPAPKLSQVKPKALSRESIENLLDTALKMNNPRRARAVVLFLLDTGARASELCGVEADDVDLHTGRVLVTGKGNKQRYVYLGKRSLSALWLYIRNERPEPARMNDQHLFLTEDGYPLNRNSLRRIVTRLASSAGVKASPHMFRHTAAIERLRSGMDLVSLQHMLGHADITTTRKYLTALQDEDVEAQAMRTNPTDNWRL